MLLHSAWISNKFVLGYCIAAAQYPTRIINVQLTELQLKQPNLDYRIYANRTVDPI